MANRDIEAARSYHLATAHSFTSVRSVQHVLDWDNRPLPYKIYPEAGSLALPRDLELPSVPTLEAIRDDHPVNSETPVDLERITRLLFCAGGLTKSLRVGKEAHHFRAAPSAGALYPIEIYLAAGEVEGIRGGSIPFLTG